MSAEEINSFGSPFNKGNNPDVLNCLANLSSDEVFTPPEIANAMLDLLPQRLFSNPNAKFLDPACKSGIFLREIAKRLLKGLEKKIPDLQERIDHICKNQLFGIAITELTGLLARRSLYCSKRADGIYSIATFSFPEGNIRFKSMKHTWEKGRCVFCGASQDQYNREEGLETYAYEWIHTLKPEEIFDMQKMSFDVVISNPPYQLSTGSSTSQAIPLYPKFIETALRLSPRYLCMIIPARWFAGGMGMEDFRKAMLNDSHISTMVDYPNAKDVFPGISISGGVCYFLRDRNYQGLCKFTNIIQGHKFTQMRQLNENDVFVRNNQAKGIIDKILSHKEKAVTEIASALSPFAIGSAFRGTEEKTNDDDVRVYSSKGWGYMPLRELTQGKELLPVWKVALSKVTSEHAGEGDREGKMKVLSRLILLGPNEACTFSYFVIGGGTKEETQNLFSYLTTKFARFLLQQSLTSINISKDKFRFVPMQDFSKPWTDEELYAKYRLSKEEMGYIEALIKPMDLGGAQ